MRPIPQRTWCRNARYQRVSGSTATINLKPTDGRHLMANNVLRHKYAGLVSRDRAVVFEAISIYLRFEWSEYKSWYRQVCHNPQTCLSSPSDQALYQIKTTNFARNRKPVTEAKLAYEIAKSLELFITVRLTNTLDT